MSDRYIRQKMLPQVGEAGQKLLKQAHILIVGAGGLGCPVLQTLVGAGVGKITLIDEDVIELSNLHRQPLYKKADIGQKKAKIAAKTMQKYNENVEITAILTRFTPKNAEKLIENATIILDCADNFAVTYIISDICTRISKPFISASVLGFTGYVGGFCQNAPSYRAIFPTIPQTAQNCNSAGVIGSAVAILGQMQAQMTLNNILKIEPSPMGQLINMDMQNFNFNKINFKNSPEYTGEIFRFIDHSQIAKTDLNIDLRSENELPRLEKYEFLRINLEKIGTTELPQKPINLICKTGFRAWKAAKILNDKGYKNISLIAMG
ncbi:MAG: ThiF family adenylyltransferase [Rhizobiales bacterium]|nr:ThiF family adenylyltransferase [Hyphomicrobiales bacterium]